MKKIIYSSLLVFGSMLNIMSQNTIPTTTVTGALSVNDSLRVTKDIVTLADMTVHGEMLTKDTVRAMENIIAQKDIKVDGSVYVGDKLNVVGNINTNGALYIKNNPVITILPSIGNPTTDPILPPQPGSPPIQVYYGPSPVIAPLSVTTLCSDGEYNPWVPTTNNFGGQIQIYDNTGPGMSYNSGGSILKMISWNTCSSIDVSGGIGNGGNGGLLMNYFCGKDITMCTGGNGGVVSTGKNFEIGMPTRNIQTALNMKLINGITKAISVSNSTTNKIIFDVASDGTTIIGTPFPTTTPYMLTVNGRIGAREIKVSLQNPWPDYVFNKSYSLQSLESVEKYINKNKHLPKIPSAIELKKEECGLDLAKMQGLQMEKIEEIYLHLIQLNKEVKELKIENEELKKLLKK